MKPDFDMELLTEIVIPSPTAIWKNANNHGWHNPSCDLATDLLLVHSEVSEACEALRKGHVKYDPDNHSTVEEELADAMIRILHIAAKNNLDIEGTIWEKHKYNITRDYRHGNKAF